MNVKPKTPEFSDDIEKKYDADFRMRVLINELTRDQRNGWKSLEEATGISKEKWRQYNRGSTKPSVEMLEALARHWPQFALWIATGVSDEKHGHFAPTPEFAYPAMDDDLDIAQQAENYKFTTLFFQTAASIAPRAFKNRLKLGGGITDEEKRKIATKISQLSTLWTAKYKEFLANNADLSSQYETEDWMMNNRLKANALLRELTNKNDDQTG